jgi:Trk K+ transport system NAD-binding subunit
VNVVGNVLEQDTLKRAKARDASAIILALSDDSESVFATAVVRDYAPEVPLIVRVLRTPNTERIYRAGADFAVSVGQVAGQILAYHLLGEHPWKVDALERTGAKVVAVERRGQVLVTFPHDFVVKPDDSLFVCGSHHSLERFRNVFQVIQF